MMRHLAIASLLLSGCATGLTNLDVENDLDVGGTITAADMTVTGVITADDVDVVDDLTVGDDASVGGDLDVTGSATVDVLLTAEDITATDDLGVGDDATIGGDLDVTGRLTVPVWNDVKISLSNARVPPSGAPDWGAFPSGSATNSYLFADNADECLEGEVQLTHGYSEGTPLDCHIHWSPITTSTNTVVWQVDYTLAGVGVTFPASAQIYIVAAGGGTANAHMVSDFPDIACTTCTISSVLIMNVCRDGNGTNGTDDMSGDVAGLSLDCHIQEVAGGSFEEYVQ